MKIRILCVGKAHDKLLRPAIEDFQQRLRSHVEVRWEFVPASNVDQESQQLIKRISGKVLLLDERGQAYTNKDLAASIESMQNTSVKELTIIIGGAFGVSEDLRKSADMVWSLSPLVYPHQIVRLLVIEQLYRTFDTLSGGKYHHA